MGTGKYSPLCPHAHEDDWGAYAYNCYGEVPPAYDHAAGEYNQKLHYDNYDDEGFDSYGYSCFDADGEYVGCGNGVDRYGYTEMDYLTDSASGGDLYYSGYFTRMTAFVRNRD
jgi:hypothetical protein